MSYNKKFYKFGHWTAWGVLIIFTGIGIAGAAGIGSFFGWPVIAIIATVLACAAAGAAIIALNKTPLSSHFGHFFEMAKTWFNKTFRGKNFYLKTAKPIIQQASLNNTKNEFFIKDKYRDIEKIKKQYNILRVDQSKSIDERKHAAKKMLVTLANYQAELKFLPYRREELSKFLAQFQDCANRFESIVSNMNKLVNIGELRTGKYTQRISGQMHLSGLSAEDEKSLQYLKLHANADNLAQRKELSAYSRINKIERFKKTLGKYDAKELASLSRDEQQQIIDKLTKKLLSINRRIFPPKTSQTAGLVQRFKPSKAFREFLKTESITQLKHEVATLYSAIADEKDQLKESFKETADQLHSARAIFINEQEQYPYYKNKTDAFFSIYTQRHFQLEAQIRDEEMRLNTLERDLKKTDDLINLLQKSTRGYLQSLSRSNIVIDKHEDKQWSKQKKYYSQVDSPTLYNSPGAMRRSNTMSDQMHSLHHYKKSRKNPSMDSNTTAQSYLY